MIYYEQKDCINPIPIGFYNNDVLLKTIDKCHENCITCDRKPTDISTNCLTCKSTYLYIYKGNCYTSCVFGEFYDNGIKKCKCSNQRCLECIRTK